MLSRRGLITGLVSLIAAPAIVRVESLMPVKAVPISAFPISLTTVRQIEEFEFLEEISQLIATTFFYGNTDCDPRIFSGIIPLYSTEGIVG